MSNDPAAWRTRIDPVTTAQYRASGAWRDTTIGERLRGLAARAPDRVIFVDDVTSLTAADTLDKASKVAWALCKRGLVPGDVVSFQLPNWHEAALVELACGLGGFVCNPIVPIYRDAEVGFTLKDCRSRVLFLPEQFRGFDYRAMMARLASQCPDLRYTVMVRGPNDDFQALLNEAGEGDVSLADPDPNHVKLILYTSGTTSTPKGVLHTHNTIDAEIQTFSRYLGLDGDDVVLMPSTVCHITGYLYGIVMPVTFGMKAVYMDRWDAPAAADLIDRHGVTFTIGATPFLKELVEFAADRKRPMPSLRLFPCGGAPVPPSTVRMADEALANCIAFRLYGSTEAPTVTAGVFERAQFHGRAETEGVVVGHEARLLKSDGTQAAVGEEGEVITKGPEVCVGYANWDQNDAFDQDGFFHTGDLGTFDADGCLTITGRLKDIIIRGGENISSKEVEDVLHSHSLISEAAVVAMPHARLGETCCVFLTLREQVDFSLDDLRAFLAENGLAKQKWPEHMVILAELPRTPSGKIRKNVLRDRSRNENLNSSYRSMG